MDKITEIIAGEIPDWVWEAFNEGQFFNRSLLRIKELEEEIQRLKSQDKTKES